MNTIANIYPWPGAAGSYWRRMPFVYKKRQPSTYFGIGKNISNFREGLIL